MSDLQTKLGGGLNILQDSLQQGKQKLQTAQEISQLKRKLQDASEQRSAQLLKLAEETYKMVRQGSIQEEAIVQQAQPILSLDVQIYQINQALEEINQQNANGQSCSSCGSSVTDQDKFCGSCGSPVLRQAAAAIEYDGKCGTCHAGMPVNAEFCGCCGVKVG
ncbi:zinc ribbon domain-containing protein [Peribacillus glennii]|uniref:Zinc ribbon domain-containing protein n=1 Tax=Peribacillus glennii TaxID=2303991 RepID=A0A372L8A4_9BACI|nr:zinc ribbon domain-containing protein [Peribacillus glennii]RFU61117.1 zinc ribbon domain-containing protein [Peribacillus glennii]